MNVPEGLAVIAMTFGATEVDKIPYPQHASWTGGILFDEWARNTFRGRTAAAQSAASTATDWMYRAGALVPFVVDDYFATLSGHQNADVALQMALIDLEAYGVSAMVSLGVEHVVGRARPYTESCNLRDRSTGQLLHQCGTGNDARSFYSGHAAATSTTAGVVCAEHQHLPLFGGGFADLAPCLFMIGVSATTGVLRLVYDEHWATDVVAGWMVGTAAGYVLPSLLHYGFRGGGHPPGEIVSGSLHALPTLLSYPAGAGAGFVGVF
ncbi:MAG TPA: phosphatase PAP2 family protein [Polyangiaceae bacterium]